MNLLALPPAATKQHPKLVFTTTPQDTKRWQRQVAAGQAEAARQRQADADAPLPVTPHGVPIETIDHVDVQIMELIDAAVRNRRESVATGGFGFPAFRSFLVGRGYILKCNNLRYTYDIADKGGNWIVTV